MRTLVESGDGLEVCLLFDESRRSVVNNECPGGPIA